MLIEEEARKAGNAVILISIIRNDAAEVSPPSCCSELILHTNVLRDRLPFISERHYQRPFIMALQTVIEWISGVKGNTVRTAIDVTRVAHLSVPGEALVALIAPIWLVGVLVVAVRDLRVLAHPLSVLLS